MNINEKISLESAIEKCLAFTNALALEDVHINNATQRVCGENIFACTAFPPIDRSLVDGYAINIESSDNTKLIELEEIIIGAGDSNIYNISSGKAVKIMTGAIVPDNTYAIIKQEKADLENTRIKINTLKKGLNIDKMGSKRQVNFMLLEKGSILNHTSLEELASDGRAFIKVHEKPKVYLITTGSELKTPGAELSRGEIFNSNQIMLKSLIERENCQVILGNTELRDDLLDISQEIKNGIKEADLIIISGGTGQGSFDLVSDALSYNNVDILFNNIDIRPGRNTSVATKDGKIIFNISGNPGAGLIMFEVLIKASINKLRGLKKAKPKSFNIRLADNIDVQIDSRSLFFAQLIEKEGKFFAYSGREEDNINSLGTLVLDLQAGQGQSNDLVKAILL